MKNKGWTLTLAGIVINLALGVLYTWALSRRRYRQSGAGL